MLNTRTVAVGGGSGAALVAVLLVFGTGAPTETPAQTDELPRVLGLGLPPPSNLTEVVGSEVPRFMDAEPGASGQRMVNPEHSRYDGLLVLDGYEHLHVYKEQVERKDVIKEYKNVILGKEPVSPQHTDWGIRYSGQYIWILFYPNERGQSFLMSLDKGDRWVYINDDVRDGRFSEMAQVVDYEGNNLRVDPLDLEVIGNDFVYHIRGHISLEESVRLANILLSIEE